MANEVYLDTQPLEDDIQHVLDQLGDLKNQVIAVMLDWQTSDMHRQYPNLELPDDTSVETDIWPRSRLSQRYRPKNRPRGRPHGSKTVVPNTGPQNWGGKPLPTIRPVLRQELLTKLEDRLTPLLTRIKWTV